jgi:hypothetical protein
VETVSDAYLCGPIERNPEDVEAAEIADTALRPLTGSVWRDVFVILSEAKDLLFAGAQSRSSYMKSPRCSRDPAPLAGTEQILRPFVPSSLALLRMTMSMEPPAFACQSFPNHF